MAIQAEAELPPSDLLSPAERRAKLRRWFAKYSKLRPLAEIRFENGGEHRAVGSLCYQNGTMRQICVGRDHDETDEMAEEFRAEFAKNAKRFCPSLPVITDCVLA